MTSVQTGLRTYPQPLWTGRESIEGKTLFIYAEQGLGDTIQFCRYAILAEARGARVILAVHAPLMRLLNGLGSTIRIVAAAATPPTFGYHIPLLSMPLAFQTDAQTIPASVPYLRAEPDRVGKWRDRIGNDGFKIGICWQGGTGAADVGRSFPVRHFEGLAKIPNLRLISLQKSFGVEQLCDLPAGMKVETLGNEFDSGRDAFIDTAAAMESLDLVITSDTAIAHLAGALGRPTWVALKHVPEWRWLLDRPDSPWYPTIRLFRQTRRGDWSGVFQAMEAQLAKRFSSEPRLPVRSRSGAVPEIPVSWGELIDKITILEIKSERIGSKNALANVQKELSLLRKIAEPVLAAGGEIASLKSQLRATNEKLWDIEDRIRDKEMAGEFDADFVELARSVYKSNDQRTAVKKTINLLLSSELMEEKSYGRTGAEQRS